MGKDAVELLEFHTHFDKLAFNEHGQDSHSIASASRLVQHIIDVRLKIPVLRVLFKKPGSLGQRLRQRFFMIPV